jgi:LacI family transcriptional regulator
LRRKKLRDILYVVYRRKVLSMNDPKYKTLAETLKKNILDGKYGVGNPLPSMRGLIGRFGVSKTTVQRALDELFAQGLISRKQGCGTFVTSLATTRKIGLIVPDHGRSEFFPAIAKEISRLAQKEEYTLLFGEVGASTDEERVWQVEQLARDFIVQRVSGVIFQPIDYVKDSVTINRKVLARFDSARIPVVLCDYDFVEAPDRSQYDVVGINNAEAGALMARHLIEAGARKVHFHLKPYAPESHRGYIRGAIHACRDMGGKVSDSHLLVSDPDDVAALKRHLRKSRPDAFVCGHDASAAKLKKSLWKLGLAVPQDLLLAGLNDLQIAPLLTPPLTTVHLPCEAIAETAFSRLQSRIANPALPPVEMYLPVRLVIRDSTKRPVESKGKRK